MSAANGCDRPEAVEVEWVHIVATRGADDRPRWNLHLSEDRERLVRRSYALNEARAWQLLRVLSDFLANRYCPTIFSQSDI